MNLLFCSFDGVVCVKVYVVVLGVSLLKNFLSADLRRQGHLLQLNLLHCENLRQVVFDRLYVI